MYSAHSFFFKKFWVYVLDVFLTVLWEILLWREKIFMKGLVVTSRCPATPEGPLLSTWTHNVLDQIYIMIIFFVPFLLQFFFIFLSPFSYIFITFCHLLLQLGQRGLCHLLSFWSHNHSAPPHPTSFHQTPGNSFKSVILNYMYIIYSMYNTSKYN